MVQFQENIRTDSTTEKMYRSQFHRTIPATAGSPTSTNAIDWHLKVKDIEDIEYNFSLTKMYCIKVRMQKISSIYKLILMIQILGSHEGNGRAYFFYHTCTKAIEIIFSLL